MKSIKQLWEEVERKAANIGMALESEEFKLLAALASRVHDIEIRLGLIVETAPGEFAPGTGSPSEPEKSEITDLQNHQKPETLGDPAADAAAGDPPAAGDPSAAREPVWNGQRHV